MKLSKAEIDNAFENPNQKNWSGDDPNLDFVNGCFTGDNWNDARLSLLRQTIYDLVEVGDNYEIDLDNGSIILFHNYNEDQHYVFIVERIDSRNSEVWHIEWYKSRGRTEVLNLNGVPADEHYLKELLYKLNFQVSTKPLFHKELRNPNV